MRRWRFNLTAMAALSLVSTGCALSHSSVDPPVRMEQELIDSEGSGQIHDDGGRWLSNQPLNLTPYYIHGGVGPASSF